MDHTQKPFDKLQDELRVLSVSQKLRDFPDRVLARRGQASRTNPK